jgi:hypothetical protein
LPLLGIPVDNEQEQNHARQIVEYLCSREYIGQGVVLLIVLDGVRIFLFFFVFEDPAEAAVKNLGHWAMSVYICAVSFEPVDGV